MLNPKFNTFSVRKKLSNFRLGLLLKLCHLKRVVFKNDASGAIFHGGGCPPGQSAGAAAAAAAASRVLQQFVAVALCASHVLAIDWPALSMQHPAVARPAVGSAAYLAGADEVEREAHLSPGGYRLGGGIHHAGN